MTDIAQFRLAAQVFDVGVSSQSRIVSQIPARMIGIFIDHDLIACPVPVGDDVVVVRGDIPVEIVEPETARAATRKHPYVIASKTAGKVPVSPRIIEVIMRITPAAVVSNPAIVARVDVGNFGMAMLVRANVILFGASVSGGSRACSGSRVRHRRRPMSRNVAATNRCRATTTAPSSLLGEAELGQTHSANQNRNCNDLFHVHLRGDNSPIGIIACFWPSRLITRRSASDIALKNI